MISLLWVFSQVNNNLQPTASYSISILTTSRHLSAAANLNNGQDLITMSLKLAIEINNHVQGYKPALLDQKKKNLSIRGWPEQ